MHADPHARPRYAHDETRALVDADADAYQRRGKVITLEELDGVPC